MAYVDIAALAADYWFLQRLAAAGQTEGRVVTTEPNSAISWASTHVWQVAAAPGFGDAYATGVLNGIAEPGRNPEVISDAMILSAVQALPPE